MINLIDIQVGDTVTTKKGTVGICTENMGDGQWIEIEANGEIELVHSQDVKTVESKSE
jgi:preprotein translocase subunit YajC